MSKDVCYLCLRIGTDAFYTEMRVLGLDPNICKTALLLIETCYATDPTMLCGYQAKTIKASVIYIAQFLEKQQIFTQLDLSKIYDLGDHGLRKLYKKILKGLNIDKNFYKITNYLGKNNRNVT